MPELRAFAFVVFSALPLRGDVLMEGSTGAVGRHGMLHINTPPPTLKPHHPVAPPLLSGDDIGLQEEEQEQDSEKESAQE